ncbi:hypothetical protein MNBD_CHLOROFLEXI01-2452 [hydrothermal vent metagenome]|uniref:Uncharacterized protein n=1 Tax=hydrothermal vent metagenome TaxID=652676 RepID=A0A3B0UN84_9ZZZZ
MLQNGAFSDGWETLPALKEANYLKNQRPYGWQIEWIPLGQPLYSDPNTQSNGIPECVHKLSDQLPPHEQLGAANALILAGDTTYKIFSAGAPFGATLSQTVTGLQPGSQATLTAPVQVHLRGETDSYGAESGVWVNGEGSWVNGFDMGDRQWYKHIVSFTVPASGQAEIVIRVKSKWPSGKDFFFDGIELDAETETAVTPPLPPPPIDDTLPVETETAKTVYLQLPSGVQIKQGVSSEANVIEVNVGPSVKVEMV